MSAKNIKPRNQSENTNSDAESNKTPSIQNAEQELLNSHLADRIAGKVDEQGNKINVENEKA